MLTSATIHQHKHPTNDSRRMWKGRKLDAGGKQVGRSADAKQTQRDAVRTHRRSAQKHGRRRDAGPGDLCAMKACVHASAHLAYIVLSF